MAGFSVSAYLIRGVLVDCGFPDVQLEFLRLLSSERLRGVVVTHWHEDHAGNIEAVASRGIPIAAHAATLAAARAALPIAFYRRFTWGSAEALRSPITPLFADDLEFVPTPGHSRDHLAVWDPQTSTLFAGDLFLGVKVRVAHHDEEPRATVKSLRRILQLAPKRLFDAHRGEVENPRGALQAKIDWMEETIGKIGARARNGDSEDVIARTLLGRRSSIDIFSCGEYSRRSFVNAVLRETHDVT
ncbi:MAG: MBL fold metallo-hydrolase [Gemmatimonadaceae bacterium]